MSTDDPIAARARKAANQYWSKVLPDERCKRCGVVTKDWSSFGVGCPTRKVYCLDHVPLYYRLKVRWQEQRTPGDPDPREAEGEGPS